MEPGIVEYSENNKPQYNLILGTKTMNEFGIILDFNSLTAIGPYMAHKFFFALFKANNFLNFLSVDYI